MIPRTKRNKLLSTLPAEAEKPLGWRHSLNIRLPHAQQPARPSQTGDTVGAAIAAPQMTSGRRA